MRALLTALSIAIAFAAGWLGHGWWQSREAAAPLAPLEQAKADRDKLVRSKECRDLCEQKAILDKLSDDWLHRCRDECGLPSKPYEPIRSISRAPADHAKK